MSRVTELEKALTTLFRKGTEVGYTETEIDEFLENIDYHALLQAVWNKAETVYAYRASSERRFSMRTWATAISARCLPPGRWSCGCWRIWALPSLPNSA